jgi:hypothetical protein
MAHNCNPSTWEDLKFEASLGYITRLCLKKQDKHTKKHNPNKVSSLD